MTTKHTYHRGYLDGLYNRPNQAEIASDDPRDELDRRAYARGYVAGVIMADSHHAAKTEDR